MKAPFAPDPAHPGKFIPHPKFQHIQDLMVSGRMVGFDRPVGRVTWSKQRVTPVKTTRKGVETVRYLDKNPIEHELGAIRSIDIDRSIGQDAATCTITMYNSRFDTVQPEGLDTDGTKGYLTPGHGQPLLAKTSVYDKAIDRITPVSHSGFPTDWKYVPNGFRDVLIPNTVLRTYQGYGSDNFDELGNARDVDDPLYVPPVEDDKLYQTGVWLIDRATFNADGTISLECRDLAKLLIEQAIYPPLIPINRFPLIYKPAHAAYGQKELIGKDVTVYHSCSNDLRRKKNSPVLGHRPSDAFDRRPASFWLSLGADSRDHVEFIQARVHGRVNEVTLHCRGGGYMAYVSVHANGKWQGTLSEVQKITVTGKKQGQFRLKLPLTAYQKRHDPDAVTTTPSIAYNASAKTVKAALIQTSLLTTGNVDVFGKAGGPWTIVFKANLTGENLPLIIGLPESSLTHIAATQVTKGQNRLLPKNAENLHFSDSSGSTNGGYFYVITSGDTLFDIAGTYYGNSNLWPIIARENNNIIKDPHWIYPGQKIKIPYVKGTKAWPPPQGADAGTGDTRVDIPYIKRAAVPKSGKVTIRLDRTITNAKYVRIAFVNLQPYRKPDGHTDYRVGVRDVQARYHRLSSYHKADIGVAGFIQDWSEAVKELCAWGGLTWEDARPNPPDPVIGRRPDHTPMRVWGDFEDLGAGPIVATPADYFTSKTFMDGIRQITDFLGCVFYIDETGGAQFRLPNIWNGGNFINDTTAASSLGARISSHPIEFHEEVNLVEYSAVISDQSVRSEILVIGGYPNIHHAGPIAGGFVLGYNPATHQTSAIDFTDVLAGQYRLTILPGDTTKLFYTEAECQRMAELTGLFILFAYRQGTLKAPCHPALQVDDQVRIFERVTYETNTHYVSGIRSHQDLESGEYTMDVTTHWLGKDPNTDWFVDKAQITPAVKQLPSILKRIGKTAGGDILEQPPYGVS